MSTATDVDVAALVGEMDAVPCESLGHRSQTDAHAGNATHYAKAHCPRCDREFVKAYCEPFTEYIVQGGWIKCANCEGVYPAFRNVTILGPVNR